MHAVKRSRYSGALVVVRAALILSTMESPLRSFFRTLADYTVGTAIVVAQLALADRRRPLPALAGGARK